MIISILFILMNLLLVQKDIVATTNHGKNIVAAIAKEKYWSTISS